MLSQLCWACEGFRCPYPKDALLLWSHVGAPFLILTCKLIQPRFCTTTCFTCILCNPSFYYRVRKEMWWAWIETDLSRVGDRNVIKTPLGQDEIADLCNDSCKSQRLRGWPYKGHTPFFGMAWFMLHKSRREAYEACLKLKWAWVYSCPHISSSQRRLSGMLRTGTASLSDARS